MIQESKGWGSRWESECQFKFRHVKIKVDTFENSLKLPYYIDAFLKVNCFQKLGKGNFMFVNEIKVSSM